MLVHASCVAIDGNGILLRGPSGSGKSDLALRLISDGAVLVADDQVALEAVRDEAGGNHLEASAPAALAGLLEVRGIGIVKCESMNTATIRLVIDLNSTKFDRMPEARTCALMGIEVPCYTLAPFEASAPAKVRVALGECLRRA